MKHLGIFLTFLFLSPMTLFAQVYGKVTDAKGEPLPFASVYVQNTSIGTSTNAEGAYSLALPKNTHTIIFQYIGYQSLIKEIVLGDSPILLDVVMQEESISLAEISITANAEDPAYAVMRKAIAKRDYYLKQVKAYQCDAYIKGFQKVANVPKKIMGREINDDRGFLDSTRQGIVYLSESISKVHFQAPNDYKELMVSSKVSGNDNGFSFNQARAMNFNLYENHVEIGRQIISPLANNAMLYYKFQLLGTFFDEKNRLINKIKVTPKIDSEAVFSGWIYITENLWNIHSAELNVTNAATKIPVLDTLTIKQVHLSVQEPDVWRLFSQSILFKLKIFGIDIRGNFTGIFTNYQINPTFPDDFFSNQVFAVEENSNEKNKDYWDSTRPIPLTEEESRDYVRKDSLQKIWKSQSFLDSIDRKNNRFKFSNLIFGYEYEQSFKRQSLSVKSPLTTIEFNTVQGYSVKIPLVFRKNMDENRIKWFEIKPKISYGFSEQKLRADLEFTYNFNRIHNTNLVLAGGTTTAQFNAQNPITETLNTQASLLFRRNYMKIYDKAYGKMGIQHEIFNGVMLSFSTEYAQRTPLLNHSSESYFYKKTRIFTSNNPQFPFFEDSVPFAQHQSWTTSLGLRFRFKQEYMMYPKRKIAMQSPYPRLNVMYKKGLKWWGSDVDFDKIDVTIEDDWKLGLVGYSELKLQGGFFLNDKGVTFADLQHFNGNRSYVGNPDKYLNGFMLLPYYDFSTTKPYLQAHFQHHFEGFLTDKLPLLRKLDWKLVAGAKTLLVQDGKPYFEWHAGIDNIGWGIFRLFRLDWAMSFQANKKAQSGLIIGVKL